MSFNIENPFHPVCDDYAPFTQAETEAMRASLKEIGLVRPVTVWNDQIVDGRIATLSVESCTSRCATQILPRCARPRRTCAGMSGPSTNIAAPTPRR